MKCQNTKESLIKGIQEVALFCENEGITSINILCSKGECSSYVLMIYFELRVTILDIIYLYSPLAVV